MKSCQVVWVLLVVCLTSEALALTLPGILSSFTASRKSDIEKDDKDSQELKEQQEKHPTTHRPTRPPLIPAIPHPADTPLNPYNNPNHPLHPDNLPHLPSLHIPSLPNRHRETIHATKTVFVEVTDRMTIHPVCMTAHKVTPPCLPYDPHHHQLHHHHKDELDKDKKDNIPAIVPTAVIELEPSRILGAVSISETIEKVDPVEQEIPVVEPATDDSARNARYVELTPSIAPPEKLEIKDAPTEHPVNNGGFGSPLNVVHNLIHPPVTHYKTKTLLVTKVEKILDTRVTATLIAENCIPTNSHIPLCAPHGGLVAPGYHYQGLGAGVFSETYGGHIVAAAGLHTERQAEYHPEGDVYEHVYLDRNEAQQGKEDLEEDEEEDGED